MEDRDVGKTKADAIDATAKTVSVLNLIFSAQVFDTVY